MKKSIYQAILLAALAASFLSCQKETESAPDALAGSLQLSGKAEKLYNEVTLTYHTPAKSSVQNVAFFLNDQLLEEDPSAPFEISWNTKEVEDGPYILKATGQDAAGNVTETIREVRVKNTLLTVRVESSYLKTVNGETKDNWLYLSDRHGKIIGEPQQITTPTSLSWERPADFYDDTLHLNHLRFEQYLPENASRLVSHLALYTYANFGLEEFSLKAPWFLSNPGKTFLGMADITMENDLHALEGYNSYSISDAVLSTRNITSPGTYTTVSVDLWENYKTYFAFENVNADRSSRRKYYRYEELQAGKTYNFLTSEFKPMEEHDIKINDSYDQLAVKIKGFPEGVEDEEEELYYTLDSNYKGKSSGGSIKAFYTAAFPRFSTAIQGRKDNKFFYSNFVGQKPASYSIPDFSVGVLSGDLKNFEVTTRGTIDMGNALWSHTISNESEHSSVRKLLYFNGAEAASYTLPAIPSFLLETYPQLNRELSFVHAIGYNIESTDTYDEALSYWFLYPAFGDKYTDYTYQLFYDQNSGGRLLPNPGAWEEGYGIEGRKPAFERLLK